MKINNKTVIALVTTLILTMIFSVGCAKSINTSTTDEKEKIIICNIMCSG